MYGRAGRYYDKLYADKDYAAEAARVSDLIRARNPNARTLLDVGCGTGAHLAHLVTRFDAEGLDLSAELLEVAHQRLPSIAFHRADLTRFDLRKRFDAVICMFSSIGYARTTPRLGSALKSMARHLEKNGVLVIEPWFSPTTWKPLPVYATFVDEPKLKIARISTNHTVGALSVIDMEYLVGSAEGTAHFKERHEIGLFSESEMKEAFTSAGLSCEYLEEGMSGKGLYIGQLR